MRSFKLVAFGLITGAVVACGTGKKSDEGQKSPTAPEMSAEEKAERQALASGIPGAAIVRVAVNDKGETVGAPEMRVVAGQAAIGDTSAAVAAFDGGAAPAQLVTKADELDSDSSTQSWSSWDYYDTYTSGGYSNGTSGYNNGGYNSGNGGYNSGNGGYNTGTPGYPTSGNGGYNDGDYNDDDYNTGGGYGQGGSYGRGGSYGNSYRGNSCGSYCGNWGHNYWQSNYKPVLYYKNYGWNYGALRPTYYNQGGYNYYCYTPSRNW